jgi:hypothetical protein
MIVDVFVLLNFVSSVDYRRHDFKNQAFGAMLEIAAIA